MCELKRADTAGAIRRKIDRSEESHHDHRLHGVWLVPSGRSWTAVSQLFEEDATTAQRWVQRFEHRDFAGLHDGEHLGRPKSLDGQQWCWWSEPRSLHHTGAARQFSTKPDPPSTGRETNGRGAIAAVVVMALSLLPALQVAEAHRQESALPRPGHPHTQHAQPRHEIPVIKAVPGIGSIRTSFILPDTQ